MGKRGKSKQTPTAQNKRRHKNINHSADVLLVKGKYEKIALKTPVKQTPKARQKSFMDHRALKDWFAHVSFLIEPSRLFDKKRRPQREMIKILVLAVALFTGFYLNTRWHFPNFTFYVIAFSLILAVTYISLSYFYPSMDTLHAEVTGFHPFDKSEYFYIEETTSSVFYVIFPLCFIVVFGVGGSMIYGSISFTPTFIWCLFYFTVVVYFSMLAYSQYIRFAVYLYKAAHNEQQFENMIIPDQRELPPKLSWLIHITKISQILNLMFFMVGGLYILAFAMFCFSPVYHVKIGAGLFYFLWIIIFVFIVLAFPIICYQKVNDIKRLVAKTKHCYIHEILLENQLQQSPINDIERLTIIMRNYCISVVLNTPNYPVSGKANAFFSTVGVIINFAASIATVLQYQGIQLFNA